MRITDPFGIIRGSFGREVARHSGRSARALTLISSTVLVGSIFMHDSRCSQLDLGEFSVLAMQAHGPFASVGSSF